MSRIIVPFPPRVGCSGVVTFQGDRPDQAIFWELVSYDPADPDVEHPPQGSLKFPVTKTDKSSLTVNVYRAPGSNWNGFNDRLRVRCDA